MPRYSQSFTLPAGQLRHDELPEERARVFVEAHQDRAVVLEARIARRGVVRADEDLALRDTTGLP